MKDIEINVIKDYFSHHESRSMIRETIYSVLIPFVEHEGEIYLLLQLRAGSLDIAPGEICFPGGHLERGETPVMCALRETEEELGIPRDKIEVLGDGDFLRGFSGFTIYTVPGRMEYEDYLNIKLNPYEVAEAFLVPIRFFLENPPVVARSKIKTIRDDFPYELAGIDRNYNWDTGFTETAIYSPVSDGKIIWGLTANIIRHLIEELKIYESS